MTGWTFTRDRHDWLRAAVTTFYFAAFAFGMATAQYVWIPR